MVRISRMHWAAGVSMSALALGASNSAAQEVVQQLPPAGSQQLGDALQRLARNSGDVAALTDAGEAALKLGDIAAAIGFFGRARDLAPADARISLGLARAYTRSRRPVEALQLFATAEKGGVPLAAMAAERGLAFDLVGDNSSAQQMYRLALSAADDPEVRRHLALSLAITGDKQGFEATLLPLLQQGDNAAFRTRAFGLAVLGEVDAAVKIARDMMPGAAAGRIEPYLRYMGELTPAQQAAAGSLGVFPRTALIGRDDAAIASYSGQAAAPTRTADASLAPQGPALGRVREAQERRSRPSRRRSSAPLERTQIRARPEAAATPVPAAAAPPPPAPPPPPPPAPPPPPPPPPPVQTPPVQSVDDAFADFELGETVSKAPRNGAVDITAIEAPREVERRSTPQPPAHPARHWVQVATGRDIRALGFDWRRISRSAQGELGGKGAFTAPWGEANRLLAGPYDNEAQAREVVNRLKAIGVDSFPFRSAQGEAVFPLEGAPTAPVVENHPERHWVQVATGRDVKALGFDWRRITRNARGALDGKGPYTAKWGEANRLLAGPYASRDDARAVVNQLKELGIDTFPFTSEAGEEIVELD